jgi:hypothetical protein
MRNALSEDDTSLGMAGIFLTNRNMVSNRSGEGDIVDYSLN